MRRIPPPPHHTSLATASATARPARWRRLRWLVTATGLVGGGILGLSQLAGFVFGLWVASSAI
jgi:hypothetical protein